MLQSSSAQVVTFTMLLITVYMLAVLSQEEHPACKTLSDEVLASLSV